jgi:hypothetical protein
MHSCVADRTDGQHIANSLGGYMDIWAKETGEKFLLVFWRRSERLFLKKT